jgi:hypothetical protein
MSRSAAMTLHIADPKVVAKIERLAREIEKASSKPFSAPTGLF